MLGFPPPGLLQSPAGAERSDHILHVDVKKSISIGHAWAIDFFYARITPERVAHWHGRCIYASAMPWRVYRVGMGCASARCVPRVVCIVCGVYPWSGMYTALPLSVYSSFI